MMQKKEFKEINEITVSGIPELDMQHQYFIKLVKRISQKIDMSISEEIVDSHMWEILLYAEFHLCCEENIMKLYNYPEFESHKKSHISMISKLALFIYTFNAYAVKQNIRLDGWDSLRGTDYYVDYRLGVNRSEAMLTDVLPVNQLSTVRCVELGLRKLVHNRTDLFVSLDYIINDLLLSEEFKDSGVYIAGVMDATTTAHGFLHKKHLPLTYKLSEVFKQMKSEGLFSEYKSIAYGN